ncbi:MULTISPECIES: TetR/AcrR family transcriptional regulator [Gammaproteobacteria]|uniref:TetR/AcrR family transcriptional regulator n=1 Tax=Gammaproteobacteria TaxID=1236 RepID=UPI000DCF9A9D|nr:MULTISPECIES: TetR/AcrR family transcriptional regulator [Gammaproteobacteria]RTE87419.1 TetR/AcrR family transcriptional regulator [Aliidiomarina sp. B3213]TCZ92796.1 TetR/AcrR family transcriptional regulator [Lysobacter sp. N42]
MKKAAKTSERILRAAETLFSEQGFEATSLREITQVADVNLASVNYHFGSKKALIQAVMARYQSVFMCALQTELDALDDNELPSNQDILACFVRPLSQLEEVRNGGAAIYLKLLGYAYSEIQGHLRAYTMQRFGETISYVFNLFHRANAHLSAENLFWRLHFALGTVLFAQVSSQALCEIAEADFNDPEPQEQMLTRLLPYIAAGIAAK